MSHTQFVRHLNDLILRVAHLGVKAFEGQGDLETLDRAIIDMGVPLGLSSDEVVEGAMRRLGLELGDIDAPEAPWSATHSHWEDHPDYPHADWLYEVQNNDTRLGYADWVDSRIEADAGIENEGPEGSA